MAINCIIGELNIYEGSHVLYCVKNMLASLLLALGAITAAVGVLKSLNNSTSIKYITIGLIIIIISLISFVCIYYS